MESFQVAKEICSILRNAGHIAYFAGGYVRDRLLGIQSSDIDIATDALPEEIIQIFPNHVLIGAQFGVVLVLHAAHQFEIATFRKDLGYKDGRKPLECELKSTPQEDASRRDFTINGMFFDPSTETIFDYVGGKADLEKGVIATIGEPHHRFQEDRLRMVRAIRFAVRFGFQIEEKTKKAICECADTLLPAVSMERIWQEFCKMAKDGHFKEAIVLMWQTHLLQTIFPTLSQVNDSEFNKLIFKLEELPSTAQMPIFLIPLFQNDEKTLSVLPQYLKMSKEEAKWIEVYLSLKKSELLQLPGQEIAHLLASPHFDMIFHTLTFQMDSLEKKSLTEWYERQKSHLEFFIQLLRKKERLVTSHDLFLLGIQAGKEMGRLLDLAEKIAIEENIKEKEKVVERLRERYCK